MLYVFFVAPSEVLGEVDVASALTDYLPLCDEVVSIGVADERHGLSDGEREGRGWDRIGRGLVRRLYPLEVRSTFYMAVGLTRRLGRKPLLYFILFSLRKVDH